MKKLLGLIKNVLIGIICVVILLFVLSMAVSSTSSAPDNAKVYADDNSKIYYAPPYLSENMIDTKQFRLTTIEKVHNLKYKPDPTCRDQGYFEQEDGSMIEVALKKIGIIEEKKRWSVDGNWLY